MAEDLAAMLAAVVSAMAGSTRESQLQMVAEVERAVEDRSVVLVQAGTGTGKSVGYLVPLIQAVRQHKISATVATATLALQRQLIGRDLPTVVEALPGPEPVRFAVLKGRGNYLCQARLAGEADEQEELGLDLGRGGLEKQAAKLRVWAAETSSGDRDDYPDDVDGRVWRSMSATGRECIGPSRCSFADSCFSERARSRAAMADIVVTNHALLALDAIDDNPVLPEHDVLVVDEAHEFISRATAAGTSELSVALAQRALGLARPLVPDDDLEPLNDAVDGFAEGLGQLDNELQRLTALPAHLVEPLAALRDACHLAITNLPKDDAVDNARRHRAAATLEDIHDVAGRLLAGSDADVAWYAPYPAPALHVAPLSVAAPIADYLLDRRAAVLTSATLTLGGDFTAFAKDLGLADGQWRGVDVGSPFSYPAQGILYVAADLERPGRDGPDPAAVARIRELVTAAGGRTLVLLSSWRAVDRIGADLIEEPLSDCEAQILVQRRGDPVSRLVDRFAADETSVLVGTMSLFQGVDVPGGACICVILDRIPFPRPDDPVLQARAEKVEQAGGSGFMAVSVPRAALLLAQGSGRLIRTTEDRGVVAVLDSRLANARYASFLRRSMPPFWPTTEREVALAALARLAGERVAAD